MADYQFLLASEIQHDLLYKKTFNILKYRCQNKSYWIECLKVKKSHDEQLQQTTLFLLHLQNQW